MGAFTAIFAASIGLVQNDIKRVLAYSTVSQLGYMFLALGVGAYWVAVFHLFTHAFFKALLFLGSGSVIHAMSGEQDMRHMGGLKDKIPIDALDHVHRVAGDRRYPRAGRVLLQGRDPVAGVVLAAWVASPVGGGARHGRHDGVLHVAADVHDVLRQVADGAECTAKIHESPVTMTVPLAVLALGSIVAGWLGMPKLWSCPRLSCTFEEWLDPVFDHGRARGGGTRRRASRHSVEWMLMGVSVVVALIGIGIAATSTTCMTEIAGRLEPALKPLYKTLLNKWYVDEIYDFLFVNGFSKGGGSLMAEFDRTRRGRRRQRRRLDDALHLHVSIWWDTWIIDGFVRFSSFFGEDALVPGAVAADRPRAGLRAVRGGGSPGVLRVLRGAVTIWTSIY